MSAATRSQSTTTSSEDRERRKQQGEAPPAEKGVRVVCRLRPMSDREKRAGTVPAATASTERKEVAVVRMLAGGTRQVRSTFHFDEVLTSFSTQSEVFDATLRPLIGEVLAGFEATAFAYGQTGTGKTYTMEGDLETNEGRGLVPRAATAVIDALSSGAYSEYSVTVSYLEIYNEELSDLLVPPQQQPQTKVELKDGGARGVLCFGLSEVPVSSVSEILALVHRAQERRRVAETRVNARSSRSHCIFTMRIRCRRTVENGEMENCGKLHLVDLAGSECAKKASGPDDAGSTSTPRPSAAMQPGNLADCDRERKTINQSLLTLGRVISALRDGTGRVPYRDSKLTRLLQDALGGRCKTVIIATLSPAMSAVDETISTLTYAEQASGIRNRPVASSLLRTIRMAATGEVRGGEGSTTNSGCGTSDWAELEMKVAYLTQEVEEAQAALAKKYREAQEQAERAASAEEKLSEMELQLKQAWASLEEGAFVRSRLVDFADSQCQVASRLSAALDASSAHGEDVMARLLARCDEARRSRTQVQKLLLGSEEELKKVVGGARARAEDIVASVGRTHHEHCTGAESVAVSGQEQLEATRGLVEQIRSSGKQLQETLGGAAKQAQEALQTQCGAAVAAFNAVSAAAGSTTAAVTEINAQARAQAERGEEAVSLKAATLTRELASAREGLAALSDAAARDVELARTGAAAAHQAAQKRLESTVREPLAGLHGALQASAQLSSEHVAALGSQTARASVEAESAQVRRQELTAGLVAASQAHHNTLATRPKEVRGQLDAWGAAVSKHGSSLAAALEASTTSLGAGRASLSQADERGRGEVLGAVASADSHLTSGWKEQQALLASLADHLLQAADTQTAGNAATVVSGELATCGRSLAASLGAAVESLAVTRENIAAQVAELQEQRCKEQEILALLSRQQEALKAEVTGLQATLAKGHTELAACRGQLGKLRSDQERGRERVLESVMGLVRRELEGLGQELSEGTAAICSNLNSVEGHAEAAGQAAVLAEERSSAVGCEAAGVAAEWSKAIGIRCGAIGAAQERCREASEAVGLAKGAAEEHLRIVAGLCTGWGTACSSAARLVSEAEQQRSTLEAAVENLLPEWGRARDAAVAAAEQWAEEGRRVDGTLARVGSESSAAGKALAALEAEAASCKEAAGCHVGAWQQDGEAHSAALAALEELTGAMAEECKHREASRVRTAEAAAASAAALQEGVEHASGAVEATQVASAAHLELMPAEFQAFDDALVAAASAMGSIFTKADAGLADGSEAVEGLRGAQSGVLAAICDGLTAPISIALAGAKDSAESSGAGLTLLEDIASREKQSWQQVNTAADKAAGDMEAATRQTLQAAEATFEAVKLRQREGVERGRAAEEEATTSARMLADETAQAMDLHQAALHRGLSAEPLEAFAAKEDVLCVPPWPKEAVRPDVTMAAMPSEDELLSAFRCLNIEEKMPYQDRENFIAATPTDAQIIPVGIGGKNRLSECKDGARQATRCATVLGEATNRAHH